MALAPFEGTVWGYQQIKSYLKAKIAAKLADKPQAEIRSPDPLVAGPAMMAMMWTGEAPHLREMYANLLAKAMHGPSSGKVHPSFVQIIQQLSPDEALILRFIALHYHSGATLLRELLVKLSDSSTQGQNLQMVWAFQYEAVQLKNDAAWRELCAASGVGNDRATDNYYRNFIRLGILAEKIETSEERQFPSLFDQQPRQKPFKSVELTGYGSQFLDVCVRDAVGNAQGEQHKPKSP